MTTTTPPSLQRSAHELKRLQRRHAARIDEIGELSRKIEKRKRQVQHLEGEMTTLTIRVFGGRDAAPIDKTVSKAMHPARVIVNTGSGSFARLAETPEKLIQRLRAHGIEPTMFLKTTSKAVRGWAKEAVQNGESLVIAVGGDGTIGDVAYELVGSDTVLGILPTGTMNNVARELGIPLDLDQACALIAAGLTRRIDVGCVQGGHSHKRHYFLESAGVGLAVALPAGQNVKKGRWGRLPKQFREMFDEHLHPIEIELDNGLTLQTHVHLVTISNGPLYALNNLIAPDARMDDGLLDVAVYDGLSDAALAAYFVKTAGGQRVTDEHVHFYRTRRAILRSQSPMPEAVDKDEFVSERSLTFKVIPQALNVIAGHGSGLAWPVEVQAGLTTPTTPSPGPAGDKPEAHANGIEHVASSGEAAPVAGLAGD